MTNHEISEKATQIIRHLYGSGAKFRTGQYEAIESVFHHHRTLVVQKTGWGKSLVYFTATKIKRENGEGVTMVVSPLLVLMENQEEAGKKLGLKCEMLSSKTKSRQEDILEQLKHNAIDIVFITPETLFSEKVQQADCPKTIRFWSFFGGL